MSLVVTKYQDTIADPATGRPIANVSIEVYDYPTGANSTRYSADGSTVVTAPIITDSDGYYSFYVVPGHYNIWISHNRASMQLTDVLVGPSPPGLPGNPLVVAYSQAEEDAFVSQGYTWIVRGDLLGWTEPTTTTTTTTTTAAPNMPMSQIVLRVVADPTTTTTTSTTAAPTTTTTAAPTTTTSTTAAPTLPSSSIVLTLAADPTTTAAPTTTTTTTAAPTTTTTTTTTTAAPTLPSSNIVLRAL